jgi:hypothetical protein
LKRNIGGSKKQRGLMKVSLSTLLDRIAASLKALQLMHAAIRETGFITETFEAPAGVVADQEAAGGNA